MVTVQKVLAESSRKIPDWPRKVAQPVKHLPHKPDNPSVTPGTYIKVYMKETQLHNVVL